MSNYEGMAEWARAEYYDGNPQPATQDIFVRPNEQVFFDWSDANRARRHVINAGASVSLIGFDGDRNVYVFDILD